MALATLFGVEVTNSGPQPWTLILSHSPLLEPPLPKVPILPLCVRPALGGGGIGRAWEDVDAQMVFTWFRNAGPLLSVRMNVDLGYEAPSCVLEYWKEEHAQMARQFGRDIHTGAQSMTDFILRVFDPWNLYCAVSSGRLVLPLNI